MNLVAILLLHLAIITSGIIGYLVLSKKMRATVTNPPELQLFLTFGIYGGLVLMIIHGLTCQWSGMASLGMFALLFIAPVIAVGVAYSLRKFRHKSVYHYSIYLAGMLYIPITGLVFISLAYLFTYLEEGIDTYIAP